VKSNRVVNVLIYLIPIAGCLVGLTVLRRNLAALYHACQALALTLGLFLIPLSWAIFAWLVAWIPIVGPATAMASFSLVIAAIPACLIAWVMGTVHALRDEVRQVPVFGIWGERIFRRLTHSRPDGPQISYVAQEAEP
jgi:uncharacterized membrane protein